jgi:L-asparaginase II
MLELRAEATRGGLTESVHRISAAVVDSAGHLLARSGDPGLRTFWRSAAKPFQALPVVADGAADRFGLTDAEVALACGSHSSEPGHVALAGEMLRKVGRTEADLACGPHVPLSPVMAATVAREGLHLSPAWSNCSGKHAAMLAISLHHGWSTRGYERLEHPLQQRILAEVSRWSGEPVDSIGLGVDGCTAVSFALPLIAMARAYARFGSSDEPAVGRIRQVMMAHPWLVAGTGRSCTDLMEALPGRLAVKLGADGIYCAVLLRSGLGVALKVEDGDMRASPAVLVTILRDLARRYEPDLVSALELPAVERHARLAIHSTRGQVTGYLQVVGGLQYETPVGVRTVMVEAR